MSVLTLIYEYQRMVKDGLLEGQVIYCIEYLDILAFFHSQRWQLTEMLLGRRCGPSFS